MNKAKQAGTKNTMAMIGTILGAIGVVGAIIWIVVIVAIISTTNNYEFDFNSAPAIITQVRSIIG